MKNIAIFASGSGSNALKIIEYFKPSSRINVKVIVCNRQNAGVLEKARIHGISTLMVQRKAFYESEDLLNQLEDLKIDFIALAGFLWLIPENLVNKYPNRIVNIHPALLPKYGGKGMYGMHIHRAVREANEKQSGLTIHYVNKDYDEGAIILQRRVELADDDSPEEIAAKVLKLEHRYYPLVIEDILDGI